jgi:prolyl-tRNA synthetase
VRIFERLELPVQVVHAEAGSMGGHDTREFMMLCDNGEDTVFMCDSCDYAANADCAQVRPPDPASGDKLGERELVSTPDAKTVEEVCNLLQTTPDQLAKTLLYRADGRFVAAMIRGDRTLNEMKLARALQAADLRMADDEEVLELTGAQVGYAGPVGLPEEVTIVADREIAAMSDFVVGANQDDAHYVGVDAGADFEVDSYADLRAAVHGDACPACQNGFLAARRAIEMAHVFKLGTKYAEDLGAVFVDSEGRERPAIMGCYGVGVSRILPALVEHYHDEQGIVWPRAAAPFEAVVLLLDPDDEELRTAADEVYQALQAAGYDTMLDERDETAGVKFAEADLIGYPVRVVVGRKTRQEGKVEVRRRSDAEELVVPVAEAPEAVRQLIGE